MFSRLVAQCRPTLPHAPQVRLGHLASASTVSRLLFEMDRRQVHIRPRPVYDPCPSLVQLGDRLAEAGKLLDNFDTDHRHRSLDGAKKSRLAIEEECERLGETKAKIGIDSQALDVDWRAELVRIVENFGDWTDDSADAARKRRETVTRLVEGSATSVLSASPSPSHRFLRTLSSSNTISTVSQDFSILVDLVFLTLSTRAFEAILFGRLLDSNALAILFTLRNFRLEEQHLGCNPNLLPHATSSQSPAWIELPNRTRLLATAEQREFVRSPRTPGISTLIARAGSGKSTACVGFCQAMGQGRVFSGLVATKRIRDELNRKFGPSGDFRTIDSLAYRLLKARYGESYLNKFARWTNKGSVLRNLDWKLAGQILGIDTGAQWMPGMYRDCLGEVAPLRTERYLVRVLQTLNNYCSTSDPRITTKHIPHGVRKSMEIPPLELVLMAQRLAEKAFDMDNETAPLDFDAMKKKACLLLESEECNLDLEKVIIVDEAQDLNECELDLCRKLARRRRLVLVGDALQSIYQFKGTTDAWTRISSADPYHLTQTLRFGSAIAAVVNESLLIKGRSDSLLVGCGPPGIVYSASNVPKRTGQLELAPSYTKLFASILPRLMKPTGDTTRVRLLLSKRFRTDNPLCLFFHGAYLYLGLPFPGASDKDPYPPSSDAYSSSLAGFRTWAAFMSEFASAATGLNADERYRDWVILINVFEELKHEGVERLLANRASIRRAIVPESEVADVTFSISHQVKGLEFDSVVLAPSFGSIAEGALGSLKAGQQHVALTRSRYSLELNEASTSTIAMAWGLHRFFVVQHPPDTNGSYPRCQRCGDSTSSRLIAYATPLPYHPAHEPVPTSPASGPGDAIPSVSPITTQDFPICGDCASKSTYSPLRDFARYLGRATSGDTYTDAEARDDPNRMTIAEALKRRAEMERRRASALEKEIALSTF